ncbi:alpha/beta hydrolase [Acinetobacter lwoffii]|uniref:alpha/beta hydrolase n=1 Tax=Acinetobacter TaxID=469 RepID=UPI001449D561|nr:MULTISPECIES: alpha/beta hydrolase [Acinetobacter]MCO8072948.1 alpha/beta hydrolase [Acinetobacter lwoffii]MCO8075926.1 alpha/beta hydrolase [Acinetobacter lwoffii]QJB47428.1 alpha/beta hydrolase [Acinetobacter sp. NEB149]
MKISPLTKQLITESFLKTAIRAPSRFSLPPSSMRIALEQMCKLFPQDKTVQIRSLRLAGLHAEEIKPQQESTQLIFHIHGGAFYLGSLNTHRAFMTQIAARTQMQVLHVDYPLSPESAYPEALEALFDVYNLLLDQGVQAKDIILSGDSCGANLALALALKIQQESLPQVSGLILLSPLLDLTLTSESLRYNQKHDALLSLETVQTGIEYYVPRSIDRGDPEVSPFFADLTGLPPIHIQVGSKEILLDDASRFKEKAEQAGVEVEFKLYTGMWHNFQMFSAWFDEAKQALTDLAEFAHRLDRD